MLEMILALTREVDLRTRKSISAYWDPLNCATVTESPNLLCLKYRSCFCCYRRWYSCFCRYCLYFLLTLRAHRGELAPWSSLSASLRDTQGCWQLTAAKGKENLSPKTCCLLKLPLERAHGTSCHISFVKVSHMALPEFKGMDIGD